MRRRAAHDLGRATGAAVQFDYVSQKLTIRNPKEQSTELPDIVKIVWAR